MQEIIQEMHLFRIQAAAYLLLTSHCTNSYKAIDSSSELGTERGERRGKRREEKKNAASCTNPTFGG
jgi:hypothetical protein